jgi:hypothetical protein
VQSVFIINAMLNIERYNPQREVGFSVVVKIKAMFYGNIKAFMLWINQQ